MKGKVPGDRDDVIKVIKTKLTNKAEK